jgi:DNA-binding MarR family transcriptional regulator
MQRDFNLIRNILFSVESAPAGGRTQSDELEYDGYDPETIAEHIKLLSEQGLIHVGTSYNDPETGMRIFFIEGLTWNGHEFLDNARNDTIWKKAIAQAEEKGTSMSMVVLNGVLTKLAQKHLGLE